MFFDHCVAHRSKIEFGRLFSLICHAAKEKNNRGGRYQCDNDDHLKASSL
jgi:hypothetical protein